MICPHCHIGTSPQFAETILGKDPAEGPLPKELKAFSGNCTECGHLIVVGEYFGYVIRGKVMSKKDPEQRIVFPFRASPRPVPPEVTDEYAQDFREASLVLADSPKASAALSRRLLQHVLRERGGFQGRNLDVEIQLAIDSNTLPGDLADDLDMVRTIGNFAAHPIKSTNSGEVVQVEPGEADGLLDVLEELLDHYFVRPAKRKAKRDALNTKLADAGKPALKDSSASPPTTL